MFFKKVTFLLMLLLLVGGCGQKSSQTNPNETLYIRIDGSSTVFPITEAVAEEFQKAHSHIRVTVGISGTGGGFKKFLRKETDINDASRPIKPKELSLAQRHGIEFIELPIAFDGISVVVNPKNTWVDYMTPEELRKLWAPEAQGEILYWDQIRKDWPHKKISLYGPGLDSGTFDYFTEVIVGKSGASRGDYTASEDDNVLVQGVSQDPYALGYFGLAYYEENQDRLKIVPIDNGQGPVVPSIETVSNGTYSPLSRPIFIYVSMDSLNKNPAVEKFVKFYLDHCQKLSREVGYVPLPDDILSLVKKRFEKRITGTTFSQHDGKSLKEKLL